MKSNYDEKPAVIEAVGNGGYFYRWDIKEVAMNTEEGQRTHWECQEVVVYAPLSSNKIVKAVIAEIWGIDVENKMLNEFNAAQLGIYNDATAQAKIAKYKAFLADREAIKAQVDNDCKAYGIL